MTMASEEAAAPTVPLLFTVEHAAKLLGVCTKTVQRETILGRMPCARVGPGSRAIRYSLAHIEEYMRRCDDDGSYTDPRYRYGPKT